MDLRYLADHAGPDEFDAPPDRLARVRLVAHLRLHLELHGRLRHPPRLPDRVRDGLLTVDVLALAHGDHRRVEVVVIRRRDGHRVDARHRGQHFAIVGEDFHVGKLVEDRVARFRFLFPAEFRIARVGHVAARRWPRPLRPPPSCRRNLCRRCADAPDLMWSLARAPSREDPEAPGRHGGGTEEVASVHADGFHGICFHRQWWHCFRSVSPVNYRSRGIQPGPFWRPLASNMSR